MLYCDSSIVGLFSGRLLQTAVLLMFISSGCNVPQYALCYLMLRWCVANNSTSIAITLKKMYIKSTFSSLFFIYIKITSVVSAGVMMIVATDGANHVIIPTRIMNTKFKWINVRLLIVFHLTCHSSRDQQNRLYSIRK